MASQFKPFFEQSRFGQKKRREIDEQQQAEKQPSFIKDSWREDFRFSDDLEALERQQHIQQEEAEALHRKVIESAALPLEQYSQEPLQFNQPPSFVKTVPSSIQANKVAEQPYFDVTTTSAKPSAQETNFRILVLEQELARLQAENDELLQDNMMMARQLQTFFEDQTAQSIETEPGERLIVAKKLRYQKIWGKLHLLL